MAALLMDIQMSPTLTTCRVLHNTSPIVLVDSRGHLFARLAEPTMAEPGENFVFLRKKKNGAVFAKVKTAPENSPAPITNPRVDVSVTNGGSPWDTAARLDVLSKISPEAVLALAVRSVNSMKTSIGLSRLEIDCGCPARHPPLSEELFGLIPPVLPASAYESEEFMNAADEKR
jgi:hypothetical protein